MRFSFSNKNLKYVKHYQNSIQNTELQKHNKENSTDAVTSNLQFAEQQQRTVTKRFSQSLQKLKDYCFPTQTN